MIRSVSLGEELTITTKNKIGLLADIAMLLANRGINIDSVFGREVGDMAELKLVTAANLTIMNDLKEKKYESIKESEVLMVGLGNNPGELKVVTIGLKEAGIDIKYLYVTSSYTSGAISKMIIHTSDNEKAMAILSNYINAKEL